MISLISCEGTVAWCHVKLLASYFILFWMFFAILFDNKVTCVLILKQDKLSTPYCPKLKCHILTLGNITVSSCI